MLIPQVPVINDEILSAYGAFDLIAGKRAALTDERH
jgi:hypothetical protein